MYYRIIDLQPHSPLTNAIHGTKRYSTSFLCLPVSISASQALISEQNGFSIVFPCTVDRIRQEWVWQCKLICDNGFALGGTQPTAPLVIIIMAILMLVRPRSAPTG